MFAHLYQTLDPASRLTVRRIGVTMAVSFFLSLFATPGFRLSFFTTLAGLAVFVCALLAMRGRQPLNADTLNHWDESAFFICVTTLLLPLVE